MVETGDEQPDYAERIAAGTEVAKNAWEATLEEMDAMAEELEAEGWATLTIAAGSTAPESPETGVEGRFGLTHVIPGNRADRFRELFEEGGYPKYEVHRNDAEGWEFLVTTLLDPETDHAVLIAGSYELRHAAGCVAAAREAGTMYTHVQKLDGTHLGSFEHDDPERFFPHGDRIASLHEGTEGVGDDAGGPDGR